MASTQPTAIIERLIDDDYVHEQVVAGGARLRDAYRRARHLPTHKAVQDPTVYDNIRGAVAALIAAVRRAVGKPKPEPPPRRGRRLLLLAALMVSAAVFYLARRADQAQPRVPTVDTDAARPSPTPGPGPTTPPEIP
jgi:hypothetical protein